MRFCHVPNPKPFSAGVIGGGITGLATAWRLSRLPQCSRITLYEKSPRLGGYIQSETIPVDGGNVVFEYGARSIRLSRSFEYILAEMVRHCAPVLGRIKLAIQCADSCPTSWMN